jgi:hypothetical protein
MNWLLLLLLLLLRGKVILILRWLLLNRLMILKLLLVLLNILVQIPVEARLACQFSRGLMRGNHEVGNGEWEGEGEWGGGERECSACLRRESLGHSP